MAAAGEGGYVVRAMKRAEKKCCACGSPDLAIGVLVMSRKTILSAFPNLRPRRRFPLCCPCRRKLRWVEMPEEA